MVWLQILFALAQAANVSSAAKPLADFKHHLDDYMKVEKRIAGQVGPLDQTTSPQQIANREKAMGEAMRAARANAKQGDVLSPQVGETLRTIIYNEFTHRSQAALKNRADAQDELPAFTPAVNQIYPPAFPLATFPPALLRQLPPLPKPLEYRFVQRYLIVRDAEANMIVDVLPNAAPAAASGK
jgi:hypothetical protein